MGIRDLIDELTRAKKKYSPKKYNTDYKVPQVWTIEFTEELKKSLTGEHSEQILHGEHYDIETDFFEYHISAAKYLDEIETKNDRITKNTLKNSNCYNMFIRYATAYEHGNSDLYRNTGTILKAISMLPLLQAMGFNHIHLLPVTPLGKANSKGNLGSPYAIKNHKAIEPSLDEPCLELSSDELFKILVDTCHKIGISVSTEFIFRTASVDSDLALDNPDWFYWIKNKIQNREEDSKSDAKYGRPNFSYRDLKKIKESIDNDDFDNLIEPKPQYKAMFANTPNKVARADGNIVGFLNKKDTVRIPYAFADWPPDDPQPEWTDVTYLKLFDHPEFNYMAYNTLRMYDTKLAKKENRNDDLWEYISGILPYWIEEYGIDGALLDMAHALPIELVDQISEQVSKTKEDFFLLGEYFGPNEITEKYFDGIVGNLCLQNNDSELYLKILIENIESQKDEIFLSGENHNTRRIAEAGGDYALFSTILNSTLGGIFYILNGTEIYDTKAMNSGLGFKDAEIKGLPDNILPLFSDSSIEWNYTPTMIRAIRDLNNIRSSRISSLNTEYTILQSTENKLTFKITSESQKALTVYANFGDESWQTDSSDNIIYGWNYELDDTIQLKKYGIVIVE